MNIRYVWGWIESELKQPFLTSADVSAHLLSAIRDADLAIHAAARTQPELDGLGTTIVAIVVTCLSPLHIAIAHVGDSRAYLLRDGELRVLTHDHTLVEDLLARGQIGPDEAASHPQRHILLRALGIEGQMEPDISSEPVQSGDVLLLCTDGITRRFEKTHALAFSDNRLDRLFCPIRK